MGLNYRGHAKETNQPIPPEPMIFSKYCNTIIGTGDSIIKPNESPEVDWECELVVVIGKSGKHIKKADALSYVAGYTVGW